MANLVLMSSLLEYMKVCRMDKTILSYKITYIYREIPFYTYV